MKIRQTFRSMWSRFDSEDIPVVIFILGLALLGYGASQIHHGWGPLIVGALVVLYVRPLIHWVRK